MDDLDNKVDIWEHQNLQQQVWDLEGVVNQLRDEITLLRTEFETVKYEGCAISKDILLHQKAGNDG